MAKADIVSDNTEFELRGCNHIALVARDMEETVDFWSNVLGMKVVKTIEYENPPGQHVFMTFGNGVDAIAWWWWPDAEEFIPGVVGATPHPWGTTGPKSAIGSMNHLAFDIPMDKFEEYREKLKAKGVRVTKIANHEDADGLKVASPDKPGPNTWGRSLYFMDPNGYLLEFCAWLPAAGIHFRGKEHGYGAESGSLSKIAAGYKGDGADDVI